MVNIGNNWDKILKEDFESDSYRALREFLKKEYQTKSVLPKPEELYNALRFTPPEEVKVVILGQDPYPTLGNAMGLAFSVREYMPLPMSLRNIFAEIQNDLGINPPHNGDLTFWAKQGVLLLNSSLSVVEGKSGSHYNIGWQKLTDSIIRKISTINKDLVFILWGRWARNKAILINKDNGHLILESAHPSPLSCRNGFFGSAPFSKTNNFLKAKGKKEIQWGST